MWEINDWFEYQIKLLVASSTLGKTSNTFFIPVASSTSSTSDLGAASLMDPPFSIIAFKAIKSVERKVESTNSH